MYDKVNFKNIEKFKSTFKIKIMYLTRLILIHILEEKYGHKSKKKWMLPMAK